MKNKLIPPLLALLLVIGGFTIWGVAKAGRPDALPPVSEELGVQAPPAPSADARMRPKTERMIEPKAKAPNADRSPDTKHGRRSVFAIV